MINTVAIRFNSPRELATYLRDIRDYYTAKDWSPVFAAIGFYDDTCRVATDSGCIDYDFMPDGTIRRTTHGHPSKLIEFMDADAARYIDMHNRGVS